jgi:hypothetical protein
VALSAGLGLRSLASVDGFVHADTGELVVLNVKPCPSLADGSPLWQQVRFVSAGGACCVVAVQGTDRLASDAPLTLVCLRHTTTLETPHTQAAQLERPLLPHQLLRQLARSAWQANLADKAAAVAGATSLSSAYYSAPSDAALGASDFELGGDDVFGAAAAAAGAGGGAGGGEGLMDDDAEGEEMQAAGWTR